MQRCIGTICVGNVCGLPGHRLYERGLRLNIPSQVTITHFITPLGTLQPVLRAARSPWVTSLVLFFWGHWQMQLAGWLGSLTLMTSQG
jgi:hypothetical protein